MEITEITDFFGNCQWNSWLHCLYALIFFFVTALRQWSQIREAMKRLNVNYGKKFKQWSDEAFNAGKEIEAMKRLTLHRLASSLHCFIASIAQLFSPPSQWEGEKLVYNLSRPKTTTMPFVLNYVWSMVKRNRIDCHLWWKSHVLKLSSDNCI